MEMIGKSDHCIRVMLDQHCVCFCEKSEPEAVHNI